MIKYKQVFFVIREALSMDKAFFLPHFEKMDTPEKTTRMQALAKRYNLLFQGLQTISQWGLSCTTGVFEKDGRGYVGA